MRDNEESDYMKKLRFAIIIVLLVLVVVLVSLYVIDHKRMDNNEPVSPQTAIEIAKSKLDEKSIETITNFDNPKVEEIVADTQLSIYCFEEKADIIGKELYEITFNTIHDGLLGPIVFYVDKMNGTLIGAGFRE